MAQPGERAKDDGASNDVSDASRELDSKQAKKHFRQGQRMFAMGRFSVALKSYKQAYTLSGLAEIQFNIAQCYRNMGDYQSAVEHYRRYIDEKPNARNRKATLKLIDKLEREIAAADLKREQELEREREREKREQAKRERERRERERLNARLSRESPQPAKSKPIYSRWWFWAGVAAVAGGTTAFFVFQDDEIPSSSLGNVDFGR